MEFLNPSILWGMLALGIPVLVHLWNGKQGRKIAWAATRFLEENDNQPVRHIKFEQWLLLILRLLLLTLLVFLLAKWFWDQMEKVEEKRVIHLVEPSRKLLSEFRFELQQAIEDGEAVYWLNREQPRIKDLDTFEAQSISGPIHFGRLLDQEKDVPDEVHLYLSGSEAAFGANFYPVIRMPILHLSQFSSPDKVNHFIQLKDDKVLFINGANEIESNESDIEAPGKKFSSSFNYYIDLQNRQELEIIEATLASIKTVFGLEFIPTEKEAAQLVFADRPVMDPKPDKLYWTTGNFGPGQFDNLYGLNAFEKGLFSIEAYEEIPEQIMVDLLDFLGIKGENIRLSERQIMARLHLIDLDQKPARANTFEILWILFLLVLIMERMLANKAQL